MSVIVTLEDREGEIIGNVLEIRTLQRLFPTAAGCCISHVSEYRDAMFNASQLKNLEQEISALEPMAEDEKGEWIQLKSMVRTAAEKGNLYMRFYGEPEKG